MGAIARFGPWIGRLLKSNPAAWPRISAALQRAGIKFGATAADLIAYVKTNPLTVLNVFATIGALGYTIMEIFADDPESQKAIGEAMADPRIAAAAAGSEQLKLGVAEKDVDLATAREVLRFARGHYGSAESARRAHQLHQAFFEMPFSEVDVGFRHLSI